MLMSEKSVRALASEKVQAVKTGVEILAKSAVHNLVSIYTRGGALHDNKLTLNSDAPTVEAGTLEVETTAEQPHIERRLLRGLGYVAAMHGATIRSKVTSVALVARFAEVFGRERIQIDLPQMATKNNVRIVPYDEGFPELRLLEEIAPGSGDMTPFGAHVLTDTAGLTPEDYPEVTYIDQPGVTANTD